MKALVQDGYGSADVLHLREIDKPVATDAVFGVTVRASPESSRPSALA